MTKLIQKIDDITNRPTFGPLLPEDVDDLTFIEYIKESMAGLMYCHTDVQWSLISTDTDNKIGLDYNLPSGLILHGDPSFYFKVKIEGEWSKYSADNNGAIDFSVNPIWVQFLTRADEVSPWTKSRSKQYAYSSGDTIVVDEEFIFESDVDLYVSPNFSRYDDPTLIDIVLPTQNWSRFWMSITITKCPKTSWFTTFTVPSDGPNTTSVKQGYIPVRPVLPATDIEGLPFNGYYEVNFRVKVTEEISIGSTPASLTTSQTLELRGYGGTWYEVDRSPTHIGVTPPNTDAVMGHSLQGSIILFVSDITRANRDIEYRVTLPNGTYKTLVDGYCHVKYLGSTLGIIGRD